MSGKGGGKKSKLSRFRLRDNYLRFYLKVIEPKKHLIEEGLYHDLHLDDLPEWHTIVGLAFENLVLNHLQVVLQNLQIAPSSVLSAAPYFQHQTKRQRACQIDLLIQCRYSLYVTEIKFSPIVGPEVIEEVSRKIGALSIPKGVSVRPVLIYQGELARSVKEANFFTHLIAFGELLRG